MFRKTKWLEKPQGLSGQGPFRCLLRLDYRPGLAEGVLVEFGLHFLREMFQPLGFPMYEYEYEYEAPPPPFPGNHNYAGCLRTHPPPDDSK